MKISKIIITIAALCFHNLVFAANDKPIKIAVFTPLTGGTNIFLGDAVRLATNKAAEQVNKIGVRDGQQINVMYFDTKCDLEVIKKDLESIKKLAIQYMIGPVCTHIGLFDALKDQDLLNMNLAIIKNYTIPYPTLNNGINYTFLFRNDSDLLVESTVKFVSNKNKNAKVAVFTDGNHINDLIRDDVVAAFRRASLDVDNSGNYAVTDIKNLSEQLKIIKDQKIDVVYVSSRDIALVIALALEIKKADLNTIIFGDQGLESAEVFRALKGQSDIVYFASPAQYSNFEQNSSLTNEFAKDKKFTIAPSIMYEAYASVQILAQAFHNADSLELRDVAKYINENTIQTAIGPVSFKNYYKTNFETRILKWTKDGDVVEAK